MKNFFSLFLLCLLLSCTPVNQDSSSRLTSQPNMGGVSVFLSASQHLPQEVSFSLSGLALFNGSAWVELSEETFSLSSIAIGKGQKLLGFFYVPPTGYTKLRVHAGDGTIDKKTLPLTEKGEEQEAEMVFDLKLNVQTGDRFCLIIDWLVKPSVKENLFSPVLIVLPQTPPLTQELLYAACTTLDAIFVVRMDTNNVVGSFGIKGGPTYLRMDTENQILYVLAQNARQIIGLDLNGNRVLSRSNISGLYNPKYWALSHDGKWAFVVDPDRYILQKVDVKSGFLSKQVILDRPLGRLEYIRLDEPTVRHSKAVLAVARPNSGLVSLFDTESLELLSPETLNPATRTPTAGINTGMNPESLLYHKGILYICDSGTNSVTIFDLVRGRTQARISVGIHPQELLIGKYDHIYVSNTGSSSISILAPRQSSPLKEINGPPRPSVMVQNTRRGQFYVASEETPTITVMDLNSDKGMAQIPLPDHAVSLAVFE